jgi:AcrR family transcriptional regulator
MGAAEPGRLEVGPEPVAGHTERGLRNKRELILKVGLRLFAHHSCQAVTMDQVARLAGVGRGTLYLYFPSKQKLYLEILATGPDDTFHAYEHLEHPVTRGHYQAVPLFGQMRSR